jgi:hypothetical protein
VWIGLIRAGFYSIRNSTLPNFNIDLQTSPMRARANKRWPEGGRRFISLLHVTWQRGGRSGERSCDDFVKIRDYRDTIPTPLRIAGLPTAQVVWLQALPLGIEVIQPPVAGPSPTWASDLCRRCEFRGLTKCQKTLLLCTIVIVFALSAARESYRQSIEGLRWQSSWPARERPRRQLSRSPRSVGD